MRNDASISSFKRRSKKYIKASNLEYLKGKGDYAVSLEISLAFSQLFYQFYRTHGRIGREMVRRQPATNVIFLRNERQGAEEEGKGTEKKRGERISREHRGDSRVGTANEKEKRRKREPCGHSSALLKRIFALTDHSSSRAACLRTLKSYAEERVRRRPANSTRHGDCAKTNITISSCSLLGYQNKNRNDDEALRELPSLPFAFDRALIASETRRFNVRTIRIRKFVRSVVRDKSDVIIASALTKRKGIRVEKFCRCFSSWLVSRDVAYTAIAWDETFPAKERNKETDGVPRLSHSLSPRFRDETAMHRNVLRVEQKYSIPSSISNWLRLIGRANNDNAQLPFLHRTRLYARYFIFILL
uniref:Uncharacterized protein n=1 Tax=Vespula pensylvanica TaxID=30213 RepID=A0A834P1L7_VESPE|nr:hypothetical protein H0235_007487 [Vespula pensylvanica]